jgi:type IV secretory pathway component VirB8
MKKLIAGFFFLQFFFGCKNNEVATSENDVDAARNFIRSSLDNDFEKARSYMLPDSVNNEYLDATMRNRARLPKTDNQKYKESSIRIYDIRKVNDSISVVSYSNSYKNSKDSVKVIRNNDNWMVDLKYSFRHD